MWQIIRSEDQARKLNRINVISYERLRMKVPGKKYTYAALLRRRCGVVICDEGEVLAMRYVALYNHGGFKSEVQHLPTL